MQNLHRNTASFFFSRAHFRKAKKPVSPLARDENIEVNIHCSAFVAFRNELLFTVGYMVIGCVVLSDVKQKGKILFCGNTREQEHYSVSRDFVCKDCDHIRRFNVRNRIIAKSAVWFIMRRIHRVIFQEIVTVLCCVISDLLIRIVMYVQRDFSNGVKSYDVHNYRNIINYIIAYV